MLQRHHATYHEERDPTEPLPGGVPTVAGRTPIACLNCAQAKTGCDKRVPCSRCSDKGLQCEARFARRSSKAALRAAQANVAMRNRVPQASPAPISTVNPALMEIDQIPAKRDALVKSPISTNNSMPMDPMLQQQETSSKKNSPVNSNPSPENFPSPHPRLDGMDDFMQLGAEFMPHDPGYQDMMIWQDYSLGLDMYSGAMPLEPADMSVPRFPDLSDMSSASERISSSGASIHTRSTSIISTIDDNMIPEFEAVIAAEAAWPLARCNPSVYSGSCPRTAIIHLEALEQKTRQEGTWDTLSNYLQQVGWDASDPASVIAIDSGSRDKMLAITQGFLHKALDIHRGGLNGQNQRYASPSLLPYLLLPPSTILEYFLRSYVRNLSFFYSLVATNCVDPNEMIQRNSTSTLLVLLMIAQGASAIPTAEARALSAGLIETCRISLFDIIEKDIEMCADPIALRCALLFTLLGAWSGDKWLMDIAMGQRGMYLSVSDGSIMETSGYPSKSICSNREQRRCSSTQGCSSFNLP